MDLQSEIFNLIRTNNQIRGIKSLGLLILIWNRRRIVDNKSSLNQLMQVNTNIKKGEDQEVRTD